VAPNLTPRTQTLTSLQGGSSVIASWLSGPDGVVTKPGEPALPLAVVNVTPTDPHFVLRGIGYRGGSYVDSGPLVPLTGAATTESRGVHVPFLSPVFYPSTLWTPNYFGAWPATAGSCCFVAGAVSGRQCGRRHQHAAPAYGMNLRLFYSANLSQAALSDAPSTSPSTQPIPPASPSPSGHRRPGGHPSGVGHLHRWRQLDLARLESAWHAPAACASEDSRLWKGGWPAGQPQVLRER
jgi:hypothetical protein